eukprot:c22622_g1_i1 orf=280-1995(+)
MEVPLSKQLEQIVLRFSQAGEWGDEQKAAAACDFVRVLSEPVEDIDATSTVAQHVRVECERLLAVVKVALDPSTSSGQALLDHIGLEIPSIIVKYIVISPICEEMSDDIMATLCDACSSRELYMVYMGALDLYAKSASIPFCVPLLRELPTILCRITRRRLGFVKEAIPGLLEIARLAVEVQVKTSDVLDKLVLLAMALHNLCVQEQAEEPMRQVVGIFALQLLAISVKDHRLENMPVGPSMVVQLFKLLSFCKFSYFNMLSGNYLNDIVDFATIECGFGNLEVQEIKIGAALAVYWALCHDEMAAVGNENMEELRDKLRCSQNAIIDALWGVNILLNQRKGSWYLVKKGVDLLLSILKIQSITTETANDIGTDDWPGISLRMVILLQVVEDVIVYAPDKELRQKAYIVFVRIITEVLPAGPRFDVLKALIINCKHSSMVSLLLSCVKEEVAKSLTTKQVTAAETREESNFIGTSVEPYSPFASHEVLNIIELVVRPPQGGPPDLPNQIDAVLGALNLYRFILIKETKGIRTACKDENSEMTVYMLLAMDNLEGVLCRCLELAEEALRQCP